MGLSRVVSEIFNVENPGKRSLKEVIESDTIRQTGYGFLLVFYSNFVPIRRTVFEIFDL